MFTQARFEKLATFANRFEALSCSIALAIVSSQIAERLFAFKDRCRSNRFWLWSIGGHVGTIPALRQSHFHRARGIAVGLGPEKSEMLQSAVPLGVAPSVSYTRTHS